MGSGWTRLVRPPGELAGVGRKAVTGAFALQRLQAVLTLGGPGRWAFRVGKQEEH